MIRNLCAPLRRLVDETVAVTGAALPEAWQADAPTLADAALEPAADERLYLVGLIGGKNVGKSSLVNALVGQPISAGTAHGPGTEQVVAYVHEERAEELRALLEREVPGRYRLVTHALPELSRQALLDLPDFDSHFEEHVEITRRMLRHMLFPVWLQSVEKYADRQARELLRKVTAGNTPGNFVFVLNKVDQLVAREGPEAARAVCADYAARLARTLELEAAPRVWMISAIEPEGHDLPAFRELLGRQKPVAAVAQSRQRAVRRQGQSLLAWFDGQRLPQRGEALARLETQACEEIMEQVGGPVVERILPRLMEDRALRAALADEVMQKRVAGWPLVNMVHVLLDAVVSGLRWRLPYGQQWAYEGADALVARHFNEARATLPMAIQAVFARLQQASPVISRLYAERRLWEAMPAEAAAGALQRNLAAAIEHQRAAALGRLTRGGGLIGWAARMLLTVGAALWFPIGQPVLEALLAGGVGKMSLLVVQVLGVNYLLKNVGFLAVWFVVLWLFLKWRTRQQVERWFERWRAGDPLNPEQSLSGQVLEWEQRLVDPVRQARERVEELVREAEGVRRVVGG